MLKTAKCGLTGAISLKNSEKNASLREKGLKKWAESQLNTMGHPLEQWQPITGDASFRRYFRVINSKSSNVQS